MESSVVQTATDALQAKVSAFLSSGYSLHRNSEDHVIDENEGNSGILHQEMSTNYLKLLQLMSKAIQQQSSTNNKRQGRQSPLVNAGYAIRVATIQDQIKRFCHFHCPSPKKHDQEQSSFETSNNDVPDSPRPDPPRLRILILGAGLDVMGLATLLSFFDKKIHVVEIDQRAICRAKQLALQHGEMKPLIRLARHATRHGQQAECWRFELPASSSSSYSLVSADLRDLQSVKTGLVAAGALVTDATTASPCPTLILSELVLAYLPTDPCDELLKWLCDTFLQGNNSSSAMVLYEPVGDIGGTPSQAPEAAAHGTSVTHGYQRAYLQRFQAKLDRGKAAVPTWKKDHKEQEQKPSFEPSTSLFPLASSVAMVAKRLEPFSVHAISGEKACLSLLPPFKAPELFDEHAALCLHLRSYCLACVFGNTVSPQTAAADILQRLLCPWTTNHARISPVRCCLSPKAEPLTDVWITPIQQNDEGQVRSLFEQSYEHLFQQYPSVHKMVKTALKKDLSVRQPSVKSSIGRYYRDQNGITLVALATSDGDAVGNVAMAQSQQRVVGCIGVRKCLDTEKGVRGGGGQYAANAGPSAVAATFEIHRLFVHPEYQSRGIAQNLLRRVLHIVLEQRQQKGQRTTSAGSCFCILATTLALLNSANKFYKRQGFHVVEETTLTFGANPNNNNNNLELCTFAKWVTPHSTTSGQT